MHLIADPVGGVRATKKQVVLAKAILAGTAAILADEITDWLGSPAIDRPTEPTVGDKSGSTLPEPDRKTQRPQIWWLDDVRVGGYHLWIHFKPPRVSAFDVLSSRRRAREARFRITSI
jgi:hypothetical protein